MSAASGSLKMVLEGDAVAKFDASSKRATAVNTPNGPFAALQWIGAFFTKGLW